jgi:hypothetical protein
VLAEPLLQGNGVLTARTARSLEPVCHDLPPVVSGSPTRACHQVLTSRPEFASGEPSTYERQAVRERCVGYAGVPALPRFRNAGREVWAVPASRLW